MPIGRPKIHIDYRQDGDQIAVSISITMEGSSIDGIALRNEVWDALTAVLKENQGVIDMDMTVDPALMEE